MQEASALKRAMDHINASRFTGRLRVRARQAEGELWFMAGVLEASRFGVSKGDEALKRMEQASEAEFEAEPLLPSLTGDFAKRVPLTGTFQQIPPVALMRFCERYAITCTLELRGKDRTLRLIYQIGELISDEADKGGNEALAGMLESQEGTYAFSLPPFELPAGVPRASTPPTGMSLADRVDMRLREEAGSSAPPPVTPTVSALEAQQREQAEAEARRKAEQAAEAKRKADEEAAEARRKAEQEAAEARRKAEQAAAEAKRKAEQEAEARRKAEQAAEAKRKAEQAAAEAKRKADEEAAEAKRKADEEAAEARRKAEQEAAEAKRKADEEAAEAKRKADEEAETKRKAEQEAAEAKRKAEQAAAEAKRKADEQAATERRAKETTPKSRASVDHDESDSEALVQNQKKSSPLLWVVLLLVIAAIAYVLVAKR